MARTIVPKELRELLNSKLKAAGWTSVRNFCISTGLCTPETYSAETITRVFNARDGEIKGTELSTIANVLRFLDVSVAEIREILEKFYPDPQGKMFWSLLGTREVELTTFERSFLELLQQIETTKPEKIAGLVAALESYTMAADIDCQVIINRIKRLLKERG